MMKLSKDILQRHRDHIDEMLRKQEAGRQAQADQEYRLSNSASVYLCLDDHGRYPTLIVVTAWNVTEAKGLLVKYLQDHYQQSHTDYFKITEVDTLDATAYEFEMDSY